MKSVIAFLLIVSASIVSALLMQKYEKSRQEAELFTLRVEAQQCRNEADYYRHIMIEQLNEQILVEPIYTEPEELDIDSKGGYHGQ